MLRFYRTSLPTLVFFVISLVAAATTLTSAAPLQPRAEVVKTAQTVLDSRLPTPPNYQPNQNYLDGGDNSVGATAMWPLPGGTGCRLLFSPSDDCTIRVDCRFSTYDAWMRLRRLCLPLRNHRTPISWVDYVFKKKNSWIRVSTAQIFRYRYWKGPFGLGHQHTGANHV